MVLAMVTLMLLFGAAMHVSAQSCAEPLFDVAPEIPDTARYPELFGEPVLSLDIEVAWQARPLTLNVWFDAARAEFYYIWLPRETTAEALAEYVLIFLGGLESGDITGVTYNRAGEDSGEVEPDDAAALVEFDLSEPFNVVVLSSLDGLDAYQYYYENDAVFAFDPDGRTVYVYPGDEPFRTFPRHASIKLYSVSRIFHWPLLTLQHFAGQNAAGVDTLDELADGLRAAFGGRAVEGGRIMGPELPEPQHLMLQEALPEVAATMCLMD